MKPRLVFPAASSSTETVVCSFSRSKDISGGGIKFVTPTLTKVQMSAVVTFNRNGLGTAGGADALECWTRNSGRLHTGVCQCSVAAERCSDHVVTVSDTLEARDRPSQIRPAQPARVWSTRPGVIYAGQGHEVSPG